MQRKLLNAIQVLLCWFYICPLLLGSRHYLKTLWLQRIWKKAKATESEQNLQAVLSQSDGKDGPVCMGPAIEKGKFFSVNSELHDLQLIKSKFIPQVPSSPLLSLMSRVPGEIQIGNSLQGTKPQAAKAAHGHVDFRIPSKPHWWVKSITRSGCHENYSGNLFADQNYSPSSAHSDSNVRWEITLKRDLTVLCSGSLLSPICKNEWKGSPLSQS